MKRNVKHLILLLIIIITLPDKAHSEIIEYKPTQIDCYTTAEQYTAGYTDVLYSMNNIYNDGYVTNQWPYISLTFCKYQVFAFNRDTTTNQCGWYASTQQKTLSSKNGTSWESPPNLEPFQCPDCNEQYEAKIQECNALGGWIVSGWDDINCTGGCVDPCEVERAGKITECESMGMTFDPNAWNQETCTGGCRPDCTEQYEALENECCFGVRTFNYYECTGDCFGCDYKSAEAEAICVSRGGLLSFDCVERRIYGGTSTCKWPYKCADDDAPTDPPIDPIDPDPPPQQPTPDPGKDPEDTPDEEMNKTLDAIKEDTGKLVTNTNIGNAYLGNLDKNLAAVGRNQGVINNSIKDISSLLGITNHKLGEIINEIGKIKPGEGFDGKVDTGLEDDIAAANDEEKYEGPMPEQPEFDASLENPEQYSDNADGATKAGELAGTEWATQQAELNNSTTPYNAQLTTSGANACINGTIRNIPITICFDRPWMLQGYAIMKLILIAMGYLQTAMLLNRGLAG